MRLGDVLAQSSLFRGVSNHLAPAAASGPSDALLVERIAAVADRSALAELDARHGMTLFAIAYHLTHDRMAADAAVTGAFRELWRSAASFPGGAMTVRAWLADLTRRAATGRLNLTGLLRLVQTA